MQSKHNFIESFVGILVLLFVGYISYYLYQKKNTVSTNTYQISALFNQIDGIKIGSDIKMGGVKIGEVEDYKIDKESYRVKVSMRIDKTIKLPKDSNIIIASENLMGGKYISIVPGIEEEYLKTNGVISNTQSSLSFEEMIRQYMMSGGGSKESK